MATKIRIEMTLCEQENPDDPRVTFTEDGKEWQDAECGARYDGFIDDVENITIVKLEPKSPGWCCVRIRNTCHWVRC